MKKKHLHHEQLGYQIPEGYFEHSKKEMLAFLEHPVKKEKPAEYGWKKNVLAIAAVAVIAVGIFSLNSYSTQDESFEQLTIESLEVSEEDFDQWFDENFVLNGV
ncbi:MAG: hypothetical protein O2810_05880 [Bacteroidetes bacterium]|nr:hypothetical protein [Bacteroidota bacterium]MDA0888589.1 hypothetical protein [Bacteroidota bacterium]MDA1085041.1 hypothetical protein [Bacteroidota bacterium]